MGSKRGENDGSAAFFLASGSSAHAEQAGTQVGPNGKITRTYRLRANLVFLGHHAHKAIEHKHRQA